MSAVANKSAVVNKNNITLTRGDSLRVPVGITVNKEPYTPVPGDVIVFSARRSQLQPDLAEYEDKDAQILVQIPTSTMLLELQPEDTRSLGFGTYDYNIRITMANGFKRTFIKAKLILTPEA